MRLIACGSVDDGKSTLIGRLLNDAHALPDDEIATLAADSRRLGTRGGEIDYALALDGLSAEREQGITIDVAHRYFSSAARRYILADAPGHEQYTRNMATAASRADLALVLVDARKGVVAQTRRHTCLLALFGVPEVVLVVNKMDLAGRSRETFEAIARDFAEFAAKAGLGSVSAIPTCATLGENVVTRAGSMPWYAGPSVMERLEEAKVDGGRAARGGFRLPVQHVTRFEDGTRAYAGMASGADLVRGERVVVLPSGRDARVDAILGPSGELPRASAGQSVALKLSEHLDVSRGDLVCAASRPASVGTQFAADVVWMGDEPLLRGRDYLLKCGTRSATATVAPVRHKLNVDTLEKIATDTLAMNEIGSCEIELDRPIAFDPYDENRDTGGFILIDRITGATVGAGMLRFALRRSANVHWQAMKVDKAQRQRAQRHRSAVVWLTGLPGAGKSTLASRLEARLHAMGLRTYVLDGDNLRHGLNKDLGFTPEDRVENIRRAGEVAKLMVDAGVIVIAAFISPFRAERRMVRGLFDPGEFIEVFVDTPLAVAESRDPKGLYAKARRGELANFTGVGAPYETPESPEIRVDAGALSVEAAEAYLFERLETVGLLELSPRVPHSRQ